MNIPSTKRRLSQIWFLLIMVYAVSSCEEDEKPSVDSAPGVQLTSETIESFPNTQFTIAANITDEAGIKSIHLENDEWLLNKTIALESTPTEYALQYKFKVPADEVVNSEHTIKLSVTNIGDKVTEITVPITLTLDVTAPTLNIAKPSDGSSYIIKTDAAEFKIELSLADDKELTTLKIVNAALGLDEEIALSGVSDTYTTDVDFDTPGTYDIAFTLTDATGNETTATRKVKLIETLQFDQMFLTDVFTAEELTSDLFGVPMLMNSSAVAGEEGYVFSTGYYSPAAGTEIKFIPQETSLDPFVFGASDVDNEMAISGDAIVLPAAGYYNIEIDLRDMSYTATPYTPADGERAAMYMAGRGFDGQNWDPSVATQMIKNPSNGYEYSFTGQFYIEDSGSPGPVQLIFISTRSWNLPYWRFDSGTTPRKVVASIDSDMGGTNVNIVVLTPTTYKVTFDYHLNRSKAVKQ